MKKTLRLQPRLAMLAQCVPKGARLADVGTDHGYVPVWLLQHGIINYAIASDIGREPLAHARHTAVEYGVEEQLDFRLCAGLGAVAPTETDTILIAGMGAETIVEILSAAPWTADGSHLLILQPQTKVDLLRSFLSQKGYEFICEHLVRDKGTIYAVMVVRGGKMYELTELEKLIGVCLKNDPLYSEYVSENLSRIQKALDGLRRSKGDQSLQIEEKSRQLQALLNREEETMYDNCT